jgi:uncharacterized repeat protein (TIGR03847 family)
VSSSFDLPRLDRFTAGTLGPPGQRIFYLQGAAGSQVVSLRLEKAQVAALAEYLAELLADLPDAPADDPPTELELVEPVVAEWVVGTIKVAVDQAADRFIIEAEELVDDESDGDGAVVRFGLDRAQVAAFIVRAATVVASGRPPCPLCGRPLDPDGHMCVKTNGHGAH